MAEHGISEHGREPVVAFDHNSHSNSDTIRPFVITMAPVWAVAIAAALALGRQSRR